MRNPYEGNQFPDFDSLPSPNTINRRDATFSVAQAFVGAVSVVGGGALVYDGYQRGNNARDGEQTITSQDSITPEDQDRLDNANEQGLISIGEKISGVGLVAAPFVLLVRARIRLEEGKASRTVAQESSSTTL